MLNANFIKIGLISVLGVVACGEMVKDEDPSAQATQATIEGSLTIGVSRNLVGTFTSDSLTAGDLTQLVLKTNGTFHAAIFVECVAPPCDPVQKDGRFLTSWSNSHRYITLYDTEDAIISRYQYQWQDDALHLLKITPDTEAVPAGEWLPMWLSTTAWCSSSTETARTLKVVASDCQLQNLPIGPCAGEWSCVSNTCKWDCGVYR